MTPVHCPFNEVWRRIVAEQGEEFETITALPFTYEIIGEIFIGSRTKYSISRSDFDRAYEHVPIEGPGEISNLVRGSAYIWAVLHDRRIRQGNW